MPCYHPFGGFKLPDGSVTFKSSNTHAGDPIKLPCGQCIGCRLDRARDWTARIVNEASLHSSNAFITLTYDDQHLPPDKSLHYEHVQSFLKRLRRSFPQTLRFFAVGEYGEQEQRPHYHLCLFNIFFPDRELHKHNAGNPLYTSLTLSKLWPHGFASIGQLNVQTARYCARYCLKKVNGDLAHKHYNGRKPEFARMSLRPGIGAVWFDRFHSDVYPHGKHVLNGREGPPPKYYDKLYKRLDRGALSELEAERAYEAYKLRHDNTPERLTVKETVKQAQLNQLKRTL